MDNRHCAPRATANGHAVRGNRSSQEAGPQRAENHRLRRRKGKWRAVASNLSCTTAVALLRQRLAGARAASRRALGRASTATATEPELPCHGRTSRRIGRRRDWVVSWQLPAGVIRRGIEAVRAPQMTPERAAAKPTFEADHILGVHRSSDRHGWLEGFGWRGNLAEAAQRLMHGGDHRLELVGCHSIMFDVAADNPCDQMPANVSWDLPVVHFPS